MATDTERRWKLAALALLLLATWPWLGGLSFAPMAPDTNLWIARGDPSSPGWAEWVFRTSQFKVGYRPVTALTYTLDTLLGGLRPWVYRATDLLFLVLAGAGVLALFRRLRPQAPGWAALAAAALFFAHPALEEVVPFIARRSYSLATALGLWGLALALPRAGRASGWPRSLAGGLLLALALLANEAAILTLAALPLLAFATLGPRPGRAAAAARACAGTALLAGLALAARFAVVVGVGGYDVEWRERALPVLLAAWRSLADLPGALGTAVALALAGYYLARSLSGPGRATRLALWLWLASYPLLFATQGVWFPRQAYFMLPPCALLFADVLLDTLARWRARPALRALHLLPQAALAAAVLAQSPLVRGPDPARIETWRRRDAQVREMQADLDALGPARVVFMQPYWRPPDVADAIRGPSSDDALERMARTPTSWIGMLLAGRDLALWPYIYFDEEQLAAARPTARVEDGRLTVRIPAGLSYLVRRGQRFEWVHPEEPAIEQLPDLPGARPDRAYLHDGERGELIDLGTPPRGAGRDEREAPDGTSGGTSDGGSGRASSSTSAAREAERILLGAGDHVYEWVRDWPRLPAGETLGGTHGGIAVDHQGRVYVSTEGERGVLVLAPDGTPIASWGAELGASVHSLVLVEHDGREQLLLAHLRHEVLATTLEGEILWRLGPPAESGLYDLTKKRVGYHPTGIALAPSGELYVADGYGQDWVHRYDADRRYVASFGGKGGALGKLDGPHGILLDTRGAAPTLVVADRNNARLQVFDLDGQPLAVHANHVRRPCAMALQAADLAVADLDGRVTILDRDFGLVAHLGENPDPEQRANYELPPEQWRDGVFIAPHAVAWDGEGNLFVAEWNRTGRLVKLRRVREGG